MMRFGTILIAASLGPGPLLAFDSMTRTLCQNSVEAFITMVDAASPDRAQMVSSVSVSPDGWCLISSSSPGFEDVEFETFTWRSEETSRWTDQGIPPLAIEVRITGLKPDEMQGAGSTSRPDLVAEFTLRQIPDAGQVVLERAVLENELGDRISVSGLFERLYLGSTSMMQVSFGSAAFKAGLFSMTLEGTHENPFGFGVDVDVVGSPSAQQQAAFYWISALPNGVIDDASRAELMAYAGDLPAPAGTLEISAASERGLGFMQAIGATMQSFATLEPDADIAPVLDVALDGLTLSADWSPAAQLAD